MEISVSTTPRKGSKLLNSLQSSLAIKREEGISSSSSSSSSSNTLSVLNEEQTSLGGKKPKSPRVSPKSNSRPKAGSMSNFMSPKVRLRIESQQTQQQQQQRRGSIEGSDSIRSYRPGFGAFSSTVTSSKPAEEIVEQIRNVLTEMNIDWTQKSLKRKKKGKKESEKKYVVKATSKIVHGRKTSVLKFEVEVCDLPGLDMHAVLFKRLKGDTFQYKEKAEEVLEKLDL